MAWLNENEMGFVMTRLFAEVGTVGDRIAPRGCRRVFMRISLRTLIPKIGGQVVTLCMSNVNFNLCLANFAAQAGSMATASHSKNECRRFVAVGRSSQTDFVRRKTT